LPLTSKSSTGSRSVVIDDPAQHRLDIGAISGSNSRTVCPMRGGRQSIQVGERVVDPHVAQVAVEECQTDPLGGEEEVEEGEIRVGPGARFGMAVLSAHKTAAQGLRSTARIHLTGTCRPHHALFRLPPGRRHEALSAPSAS